MKKRKLLFLFGFLLVISMYICYYIYVDVIHTNKNWELILMKLNEMLLPIWQEWGGSGCYYIPGRNVHFKNGKRGCILVDSQGIGIYSCRMDLLNMDDRYDEGLRFIDGAEKPEDFHKLNNLLTDKIINEAIEMYNRYMSTQAA